MSDLLVCWLFGLAALAILAGGLIAYALALQMGAEPTWAQKAIFGAALSAFASGTALVFWLLKKTIRRKWRAVK